MSTLHHWPERFRQQRVLIIGDAILDTYIKGTSDRLCREAPAPVISLDERQWRCGGAANTAVNIAALGASASLMTVLGEDAHARILMEKLSEAGVDTTWVRKSSARRTVAKTRISAASTILLRIDEGSTGPLRDAEASDMAAGLGEIFDQFDAIVVSDYDNGIISEPLINTFASIASKIPVVIDARNPARFRDVHALAAKPNYEESLRVLGLPKLRGALRVSQLAGAAEQLLEQTGAEHVYATLDSDGTLLLSRDQAPFPVSCIPRDEGNSVGAGDSYVGALALSLCSGATPEAAARIASTAANVVLQTEGTSACSGMELRSALKGDMKYLDNPEDLHHRLREFRKHGKRVVFTNGCFDILHRGHVNFLKKARALGDVLIVGLNSDDSIRRIKGKTRPINSLADRIEVLSGLQSVDGLVPFDDDSPVELIKTVRPDIFVKGGGYIPEDIPEADLVRQLGGEVKVIPAEEGFSTSLLIEKIHDRSAQPRYASRGQGTQ